MRRSSDPRGTYVDSIACVKAALGSADGGTPKLDEKMLIKLLREGHEVRICLLLPFRSRC